jgi:hypothetical protein
MPPVSPASGHAARSGCRDNPRSTGTREQALSISHIRVCLAAIEDGRISQSFVAIGENCDSKPGSADPGG